MLTNRANRDQLGSRARDSRFHANDSSLGQGGVAQSAAAAAGRRSTAVLLHLKRPAQPGPAETGGGPDAEGLNYGLR